MYPAYAVPEDCLRAPKNQLVTIVVALFISHLYFLVVARSSSMMIVIFL